MCLSLCGLHWFILCQIWFFFPLLLLVIEKSNFLFFLLHTCLIIRHLYLYIGQSVYHWFQLKPAKKEVSEGRFSENQKLFHLSDVKAWMGQPVGLVGVVSGDTGGRWRAEWQDSFLLGPPADWQVHPEQQCERRQKLAACSSLWFKMFLSFWAKYSSATLESMWPRVNYNVSVCLCLTLNMTKDFQKYQS